MSKSNADLFFNNSIRYFKVIGFEFDAKRLWMKFVLFAGLMNMVFILMAEVALLIFCEYNLDEDASHITWINYFSAAFAKISTLIYKRKAIFDTFNEFREIYPSAHVEKEYNLQCFLNQYLLIEKFLVVFFQSITAFFLFLPSFNCIRELLSNGRFLLRLPMKLWYSDDMDEKYLLALTYLSEIHSTYMVAIIILGLDLALFSSLLQLCMHFDIINKNILNIEPDGTQEVETKLKIQIAYHQRVLRLAEKVNAIFTPSVLFSLMSSSFIICFTGFDMIGNLSIIHYLKVIYILAYELKQVVIICFLGDKLMEISSKTSEAIYEHKWYNGTMSYKRLVLIVLMRSQKPASLNIVGISDIGMPTLRAVLSFSYQFFTVLNSV